MKKTIKIAATIIALVLAYTGWNVFGPVVSAPNEKYFYIHTGSDYENVKNQLSEQHVLKNFFFFDIISKRVGYNHNVKAGRYSIKNGSNIISLIRMLKSGSQAEVRLVINKIRTKEEFAIQA